jgi:hypothetical protein
MDRKKAVVAATIAASTAYALTSGITAGGPDDEPSGHEGRDGDD